ncbi:MAG: toxin-antitoxin system, antitoxin component, Xre family protein [Geminicoccaceae bacterium]
MPAGPRRDQEPIAKIRSLPADRIVEVEDFVDFLRQREEERRLARAVTGASEAAFEKVCDNPDDAAYDRP